MGATYEYRGYIMTILGEYMAMGVRVPSKGSLPKSLDLIPLDTGLESKPHSSGSLLEFWSWNLRIKPCC